MIKHLAFVLFISCLIFACKSSDNTGIYLQPDTLVRNKAIEYSCKNSEKIVFYNFLNELRTKGYEAQKLKNWNRAYKNHITEGLYHGDSLFTVLPENQIWLGIKPMTDKHNRETIDILFSKASVTESVVRKNLNGSLGGDIKIVQFLFSNSEDAENSIEKMKLISYYTINTDGLKNPNFWWIHNCAVYFCRTRSAGTSIKPIWETFQEKYGEIKLLRW